MVQMDFICQRYVANRGIMDETDVEILKAAAAKSLKRGNAGKKNGGRREGCWFRGHS